MTDSGRSNGRQPYDWMNGVRVGALTGGLVSTPVAGITRSPWPVIIGTVVGGGVGWVRVRQDESDRK